MSELGTSSSLLGYRQMRETLAVKKNRPRRSYDKKGKSNQKKNISHYWVWLHLLYR